jgi:hypothetical protein
MFYTIEITGSATRIELAVALRLIADQLEQPAQYAAEDIAGAEFNDCSVRVESLTQYI